MACGKPVLAYAGGGALETVREGVTGGFFYEQTPESVAEAVSEMDADSFDPWEVRKHAELFDVSVFTEAVRDYVTESYHMYKSLPLLTADERFGILARTDSRRVPSEQGARLRGG
jgi:hypothetical protein